MQTSRLISTISYNTATFLKGTLRRLVESGIIEYAHWIRHTAEDAEKKDHWHIIAQPNKRLDTNALRKQFTELALPSASAAEGAATASASLAGGRTLAALPDGQLRPLMAMPWQPSKMRDWMLYAVHDRAYLLGKGEVKKYEYKYDDLLTTLPEQLDIDWANAHTAEDAKLRLVLQGIEDGIPFVELVKKGVIPVGQYLQYRRLYCDLMSGVVG